MKLVAVLRVASVFALSVCAVAGHTQQSATRQPTANYRISGKVVDAHTGMPVARCSVHIVNVKNTLQTRKVKSGDDGAFSFDSLPMGKYSLAAERHGYLAQNYEEHGQFSTAIVVGPKLISEDLTFKLVAESVIGGTVIDDAGEPIRGAQVRLFEDQDVDGNRATRAVLAATTDDRGIYEIIGIKPGAYFLVVTAQPWYTLRPQQVTAEPNSQARALDVAYPATYYSNVTEEDAATPIPVRGGERLTADFTLAAKPAIHVRVLKTPGAAEETFTAVLSHTLFGQVESLATPVMATPDGVEVSGILPGHYDVTLIRFAPGPDMRQGQSKHFSTNISSDSTELSESGAIGYVTITGRVTAASGTLPKQALLALFTMHREQQAVAQLDGAGTFSLAVPPGSYEVIGEINGMYIASLKAVGASIVGRTLTVKAGESPILDVVAGDGYGEIEGTALRGDTPMSAVMVLLAPEDPKNNKILFSRDQSDSDGTFDMAKIVPGRYHLLAIERGWELEWANPNVLRAFMQKSVAIELRAGEHLVETVQVQHR